MLILDTNVVSEFLKPAPDEAILAWLDAQPRIGTPISLRADEPRASPSANWTP